MLVAFGAACLVARAHRLRGTPTQDHGGDYTDTLHYTDALSTGDGMEAPLSAGSDDDSPTRMLLPARALGAGVPYVADTTVENDGLAPPVSPERTADGPGGGLTLRMEQFDSPQSTPIMSKLALRLLQQYDFDPSFHAVQRYVQSESDEVFLSARTSASDGSLGGRPPPSRGGEDEEVSTSLDVVTDDALSELQDYTPEPQQDLLTRHEQDQSAPQHDVVVQGTFPAAPAVLVPDIFALLEDAVPGRKVGEKNFAQALSGYLEAGSVFGTSRTGVTLKEVHLAGQNMMSLVEASFIWSVLSERLPSWEEVLRPAVEDLERKLGPHGRGEKKRSRAPAEGASSSSSGLDEGGARRAGVGDGEQGTSEEASEVAPLSEAPSPFRRVLSLEDHLRSETTPVGEVVRGIEETTAPRSQSSAVAVGDGAPRERTASTSSALEVKGEVRGGGTSANDSDDSGRSPPRRGRALSLADTVVSSVADTVVQDVVEEGISGAPSWKNETRENAAAMAACASRMFWIEAHVASGLARGPLFEHHIVLREGENREASPELRGAAAYARTQRRNDGEAILDSTIELHNRAHALWKLVSLGATPQLLEQWQQGGKIKGPLRNVIFGKTDLEEQTATEYRISQIVYAQVTADEPRPLPMSDICANFLQDQFSEKKWLDKRQYDESYESEYNRFENAVMRSWQGGSITHKTAVTLNYDLDLALDIPANVGNRRIWRKAHQRLQRLLRIWGIRSTTPPTPVLPSATAQGQDEKPTQEQTSKEPALPPSLAFSASGLTEFSRQKGNQHSSVFDVSVFPAGVMNVDFALGVHLGKEGAGIADGAVEKTSPGTEAEDVVPSLPIEDVEDRGAHDHTKTRTEPRTIIDDTLYSDVAEDYRASPFQVDVRFVFQPTPGDADLLGLRPWWVRRAGDEDLAKANESALAGTDVIIRSLLDRLNRAVAHFIQLAKRWAKERLGRKEVHPLNGISITLFGLRYLWLLLGGGGDLGRRRADKVIRELGVTMGVHGQGKRRSLILTPGVGSDEESPAEFVLELFFGFMRFLVGEAEQVLVFWVYALSRGGGGSGISFLGLCAFSWGRRNRY